MLPILRMIPVGGVFIAAFLLVLGFSIPGASRTHIARIEPPARGALIARAEHPEWRQFLILAATRRASEIERLRALPDAAARGAPAKKTPRLSRLPLERGDAGPDDTTGSITQTPGIELPLEIGEPSSTELPVRPRDVAAPPLKPPERAKPANEGQQRGLRKVRRAKPPAKPESATPVNPFSALFGGTDAH